MRRTNPVTGISILIQDSWSTKLSGRGILYNSVHGSLSTICSMCPRWSIISTGSRRRLSKTGFKGMRIYLKKLIRFRKKRGEAE